MPYVATEWKNGTAPSLSAENLNKLEAGLVAATAKAEKAVAWGDITNKPSTFAPTIGTTATTAKAGNYAPAWSDVTGKPTTFAPIIGDTATTALAGNTPLLQIGTTSTTAKAGNYTPSVADIPSLPTSKITSGTFAIAQIPTGATATTVALGNHTHAASAISVTATGTLTGANVQAALEALAARIAALETP